MNHAPTRRLQRKQRGTTLLGLVIGLVLGLGLALAVAVYVTKVPLPFTNKNQARTPEQDAAELRKNQNWDPNALLQGKPKAAASAASAVPAPDAIPAAPQAASESAPAGPTPASAPSQGLTAPPGYPAAPNPPAVFAPGTGMAPSAASAPVLAPRAASAAGVTADPFQYFVQAGAFRSPQEAEAQRAKLSLMGLEARVTEREQSGRTVYRVRLGPFDRKEEADRSKAKLDAGGVEAALVRVVR